MPPEQAECNARSLDLFCLRIDSSDLEVNLAGRLADRVASAQTLLREAGCTPLAQVLAAAGVMDLVFFTACGARLLVRCSVRTSQTADVETLATIHRQRTFDHVVLLTGKSDNGASAPSIISFSELTAKAPALAMLPPGWAI